MNTWILLIVMTHQSNKMAAAMIEVPTEYACHITGRKIIADRLKYKRAINSIEYKCYENEKLKSNN